MLYAAINFGDRCAPEQCAVWGPFAEFHPFSNWQAFFFGMCIGRLLQDTNVEDVPSCLRKNAATTACLVLLALLFVAPLPSERAVTLFLEKGPLLLPIFAMLIYFLSLGDDVLLRPWILENPVLQYLGAVSGHYFLLYWPVRSLLVRAAPEGMSVAGAVGLPFLAAIAFF